MVEHVVSDDSADIFDGVIVHTLPLVGRRVFADVDQIAELRERGVLLSADREALHEPREGAADRDPEQLDRAEGPLEARLRRAGTGSDGAAEKRRALPLPDTR